MLYDDEQLLTNVASINEMAKEYAKSIENKRQEKLIEPLTQLLLEQTKVQNCYNALLKFAKQNALPFIKELLTDATKNIEKIKTISSAVSKNEEEMQEKNNYVQIFKNALQFEINSLLQCNNCLHNCKDEVGLSILNEIEENIKLHIEKLISCF